VRIEIPRRFNGPDESGNGGYSACLLGRLLDGAATVRLHRPPPLDTPLSIEETPDGLVATDDGVIVMSAASADLWIAPPPPVTSGEAEEAVARFPGWDVHGARSCFVCGPDRQAPDGLRVFPGRIDGDGVVASPWTPHPTLADGIGVIPEEIVWGVLDCPGAWAGRAYDLDGMPYFPALGTMTASVDEPVRAGEPHVVVARYLGTEGRKLLTESWILGPDGAVKARAAHITIKVPVDWAAR
jgi:hypothetical protein